MKQVATDDRDSGIQKSYLNQAKAIEELLIGSGGEAFREIERRIFRFCPFEAIGMVRQEVRHLSGKDVQTSGEYARAEADGGSAEDLGKKVITEIAAFLQRHMPVYNKALRKALAE